MFRSLRTNQQFYILTKGANPRLDVGLVTSVSQPVVKFQPMPQLGAPTEYVVDVNVSLNGAQQTFQKLPADKEIADFGEGFGNIVVTANRDAMNAEIASLKNKSEEHLKRVEEEQQKIVAYEAILQQLNPEYAEKQRQEQEIASLKNQVSQMASGYSRMESLLEQLLAKSDGESKQSKTK